MANGLNKVMLIGNLGKDPEIKILSNGNKIANFSLATGESWRDKQTGERKERTEWHNVVVYNENIAKIVGEYCRKGSRIYLEGVIRTRKWQDKTGADRWSTEIIVENFRGTMTLLDTKAESEARGRDEAGGPPRDDRRDMTTRQNERASPSESETFRALSEDLDDQIPF